ncbi:rhodanese-like domain-containing protein [uncultured Paludibaculum sp.]
MALRLQKMGFANVRPLQGGYDEWVAQGYPVDSL